MICITAVRMAAWRAVAVGATVCFLAACSADGGATLGVPSATVATAPPQTTTTNPYAIPEVIDAAYVNRVLAGLDAATSEVIRLVVTTRSIPPESIERLQAIYSEPALFQLRLDLFQDDLRRQLGGYKPNPGANATTVIELLSTTTTCVFAKVSRDASAVAIAPDPRFSIKWIAMKPFPSANRAYNDTGWGLIYEGFERDLTAPRVNPCDAA